GDGNIVLPALYATIEATHGQRARFEAIGDQVHMANWTNAKDNIAWKFEVPTEGVYEVSLVYSADASSAEGKYAVSAAAGELAGQVQPTGAADKFETRKLGELKISAGQQ